VRYLGVPLGAAVAATFEEELTSRGAYGGLIAVSADGGVVVAHNSPMMFSAYSDGSRLVTHT
jgi:beta-aspartyl-peptidase (threonine type)